MNTETTSGDTSACECPYCHKLIHDLWDYGGSQGLREDLEIECPHCDKTSVVEMAYKVYLSTIPDKKQEAE